MHHKAFNIIKNPKYDGYQHGLASMVYNFFDKKSFLSGLKGEIMLNQELAEELHKPIIRKFKKQKVYIYFKVNIWGTDLAYMQLISKFNKGFRFLLCYWYSMYRLYLWNIKMVLLLLILFKKCWISLITN